MSFSAGQSDHLTVLRAYNAFDAMGAAAAFDGGYRSGLDRKFDFAR